MSTKEYTNFYESIKEARMRIEHTIVLYDGAPHYVLTVCDHKEDGIFRVYMEKLGNAVKMAINNYSVPYEWHDEPGATRGAKMDEFMDKYPDSGIVRKMMNSPLFNKFRPFPLGMCNNNGAVVYLERSPTRSTYQGLTGNMVSATAPSVLSSMMTRKGGGLKSLSGSSSCPHILSDQLADTILGVYPSFDESLGKLKDPKILNDGVAFHRNFALIRGPLNMLFVAYRSDIVAYLPNGDKDLAVIGRDFAYTKEVIDDLGVFRSVIIR